MTGVAQKGRRPSGGDKQMINLSEVGGGPGPPGRGLGSPRGMVGNFLLISSGEKRTRQHKRVSSRQLEQKVTI
eukprot:11793963-Alexandrium_andersonii.AAC.1